jgi:hypothetical protein
MSSHRSMLLLIGLLVGASLLGCTIIEDLGFIGGPSRPTVEVLSPLSGSQVTVGQQVEVQFRASDSVGVVHVELVADGSLADSLRSQSAGGEPSMSGALRWTPTTPGNHTLTVYAYNTDGEASDAVGLSVVAVGEPGMVPTVPPELPPPVDTPLPSPPVAPVSTPIPPPPTYTLAPLTPVSPPPTRPSVPPTPTSRSINCPTLTIIVPDWAPPRGVFGIQFRRVGDLPDGYGYVVENSWDRATWQRAEPVPASVRPDGAYWMAETRAPGGEGTVYWRICLVDTANLGAASVCCTPPWEILHSR